MVSIRDLSFSRTDDKLAISMQAVAESDENSGNVSESYMHLYTMVRLRN